MAIITIDTDKLEEAILGLIEEVDRKGFLPPSSVEVCIGDFKGGQVLLMASTDEDDHIEHDGEFVCVTVEPE